MGPFKVGTLVALAFASGGGVSAYVFTALPAGAPAPQPPRESKVADEAQHTLLDQSRAPREQQPQSESALQLSTADGQLEEQAEGRSAAEILWALEQAYRGQEERIRLLEASLADESEEYESPGEESAEELDQDEEVLHATQDAAPDRPSEALPTPDSVLAQDPAPAAVALLDEPFEPADEAAPVLQNQQVIVLNHYQPVYFAPQLPTSTSSESQPGPGRSSTGFRASFKPDRPAMNGNWVASGFDVYTKR